MSIEKGDFVRVFGYTSQKQYLKGKSIFRVMGMQSKYKNMTYNESPDNPERQVYCVNCDDPNKGFHVSIFQCKLVGKGIK